MADAMASNQDIFICPICLDFLKDPGTLHCGHNYCLGCIGNHWDTEGVRGVYSCPQCRQTFTPRPVLNKNIIVAELVDQMKSRICLQTPVAGPADVACNVCTGRKRKAVKSCLECLMSYCGAHLKGHNVFFPGRNHTLIDATGQLQEMSCPHHKKVFDIFCRTDQRCICYLCMVDDHRGHDMIPATAEWILKKEGLFQSQMTCQQIIQLKEKELQEMRKVAETIKCGVEIAEKDSERMLTEMIRSIKRRCTELRKLISVQKKADLRWANGPLRQLEKEIAELKRTDAEMKELSLTQDPIYFLKNAVPIVWSLDSNNSTCVAVSQSFSLETLNKSLSALRMQLEEKLDHLFKQEISKISAAVFDVQADRVTREDFLQLSDDQADRVTREDFLQYSCHFTLDSNTAHAELLLSEGYRRVARRHEALPKHDHPDRFDVFWQVLCREGVSARCYWEVERSGGVDIVVSYKSISRKGVGTECLFGYNDQSWRLYLSSSNSSVIHDSKQTELPLVAGSKIGVYVDLQAGTLAFYSISDTMTLLHRVNTTFTHSLYPGFGLHPGSSVKFL